MDFRVVDKGKDTLKVEVLDNDNTLFYPLISALLRDEDVGDVKYAIGHPELDKPVIQITTKKGKPQAALARAAKNLAEEFKEAREQLEKQL